MEDEDMSNLYKDKYALFQFDVAPWSNSTEKIHIAPAKWVKSLEGVLENGHTKVIVQWPTTMFRNYIKLERDSSNLDFEDRNATVVYTGSGKIVDNNDSLQDYNCNVVRRPGPVDPEVKLC